MRAPSTDLYEREQELGFSAALLDSVAGGSGAALVIEGPPGIGKTRLLTEILAMASDRGFTLARARGAALERQHGFGLVRQLFQLLAATTDESQRFVGAAELARTVLWPESAAPASPVAPDRFFASLHGLYWLGANLAARAPLLLAVDDAHWGDAGSLAFFEYLLRRADGVPVLVALARRPGEPGAARFSGLLATDDAHVLRPAGLTRSGVRHLVEERCDRSADERFVGACRDATGGNPFLVSELCLALTREGVPPTAEGVARIREIAPAGIIAATVRRLEDFGSVATALARAAEILGPDADLARAAELADLPIGTAASAADHLVQAGLLASTRPLAFVHPLVANAISVTQPPADRALAHLRAAHLLADRGAEEDRICGHLLECERLGDSWVVEHLQVGARNALALGAPATAVSYLRRALVESPGPRQQTTLRIDLGRAELIAGDPSGLSTLADAIDKTADPRLRAEAALAQAQSLAFAGSIKQAVGRLDHAVADFDAAGAVELGFVAQAELVNTALLDTRTASRSLAAADRLRREGAAEKSRPVLAALASAEAMAGHLDEATAMARRALSAPHASEPAPTSPVDFLAAWALVFADRNEEAEEVLLAAWGDVLGAGSPVGLAATRSFLSHIRYRQGAVLDAESYAREALGILERLPAVIASTTHAFHGDALLERGALASASATVDSILVDPEASGALAHLLHTRGRVRLRQGRLPEAICDLRDCGRRMEAIRARNPATIPWRSSLAPALQRAGQAREALELADEEVMLARAHGGRRTLGIALLGRALCSESDRALESFEEAVDVLRASTSRLEEARALLGLGAWLRRHNRRAESLAPLRRALDHARRCGSIVLAREARAELAAAGVRPRHDLMSGVESLTASELRVARLAAEGRSNPSIAQTLFVTRKTIEAHLSNAYRKLGIASRTELGAALKLELDAEERSQDTLGPY